MKLIGIDPSLAATGLHWGEDGAAVYTKASDPQRLSVIFKKVCEKLEGVHLAVIEDLPTHAHSAGLTGQVQGVVRLALQIRGVPYIAVPPASLKVFATGSGRANKEAMRSAAEARLGSIPNHWDDNVVDAFWLEQMGVYYVKERGLRPEDFAKAGQARWGVLKGLIES